MQNGQQYNHLAVVSPSFALYGQPINVWIDYDAQVKLLQVYADPGMTRPAAPLLSYSIDIAAAVGGTGYVGFTAGTSGSNADQDIVSWQFNGHAGLQVDSGDVSQAFFPRGGQTTVITGLVVGPQGDPALTSTPFSVSATLADSTGAVVRTLATGDQQARWHWRWDGTDDTGELVPSGVYTATIQANAQVGGVTETAAASIPIPSRPMSRFRRHVNSASAALGRKGITTRSRSTPSPGSIHNPAII